MFSPRQRSQVAIIAAAAGVKQCGVSTVSRRTGITHDLAEVVDALGTTLTAPKCPEVDVGAGPAGVKQGGMNDLMRPGQVPITYNLALVVDRVGHTPIIRGE